VKITGNNTGALTLVGTPAKLKLALNALTLHLAKKHAKGSVTLTITNGSQNTHTTIAVSS
jgi:hypothetical protein